MLLLKLTTGVNLYPAGFISGNLYCILHHFAKSRLHWGWKLPLQKTGTYFLTWWRHQNGSIFRVTGPLCGELTGSGEYPAQRPVTQSFDVFFDLRPNKRLSKQPWGWWFQTPSWSLWRHCNVKSIIRLVMNLQRKESCYQQPCYWPCYSGILITVAS